VEIYLPGFSTPANCDVPPDIYGGHLQRHFHPDSGNREERALGWRRPASILLVISFYLAWSQFSGNCSMTKSNIPGERKKIVLPDGGVYLMREAPLLPEKLQTLSSLYLKGKFLRTHRRDQPVWYKLL